MRNYIFFVVVMLCSFTYVSLGGNGTLPGTGTQDDPYLIEDRLDFDVFASESVYWSEGIVMKLMIDLDLSDATYPKAVIAPNLGSSSRYSGTPYEGIFNGNGHCIRNLHIYATSNTYLGLFGYLESSAEIIDLGVEDVSITGWASIGGLCGHNEEGTIRTSFATGTVYSNLSAGGLCGSNDGAIENCYAVVHVTGDSSYSGGLCGSNSGTVNNSYAAGMVTGSTVGGLCGYSNGTVTNSFWDRITSGQSSSYGGTGLTTDMTQTLSTYTAAGWSITDQENNTALWMMPVSDYPKLYWQSHLSFSGATDLLVPIGRTRLVSIDVFSLLNESISWTLSGYDSCPWITDISPVNGTSTGPDDKTELSITIDTTGLTPGNYSQTLILTGDNGDLVYIPIELETFISLPGDGTESSPYLIESLDDFNLFSSNPLYYLQDVYTELMCDIDLTGTSYETAVIAPDTGGMSTFAGQVFNGSFNGNGHTINHLTIDSGETVNNFLGLFGCIGTEGSVTDLKLDNVTITGSGDYLGTLCGKNEGTLTLCTVTGSISGTGYTCDYSGGLVGINIHNIVSCQVHVDMEGLGLMGGLCGQNSEGGTIFNCICDGSVQGDGQYIGGITGLNEGEIIGCNFDNEINNSEAYTGGIAGCNAGSIELSYAEGIISTTYTYGGGVCGLNTGMIVFSYFSGQVIGKNTASNNIGGLCGASEAGQISNCYSEGTVSSLGLTIGGFSGSVTSNAQIVNSYSACQVEGNSFVGGFCGINQGLIGLCYSTGTVDSNDRTGAFCGANIDNGTIGMCYSTGDTTGTMMVGGFCGTHMGNAITSCYSTGDVSGSDDWVGGFCGLNYATIGHCYSTGFVDGESDDIGGFCGSDYYHGISGCFWDTQTSLMNTSEGGTGKMTAQMQDIDTFLNALWDFTGETINGTDDVWIMDGYPMLSFESALSIESINSEMTLAQNTQDKLGPIVILTMSDEPIEWTVTGYETCPWISGVTQSTDSVCGPTDISGFSVNVDTTGIAAGDYTCDLVITDSNNNSKTISLVLHVFKPVNLEEFSLLARYWLMDSCDGSQDCLQADFYIDGTIDMQDLLQVLDSWLCDEMVYGYAQISEGFESGDFNKHPWTMGGDADWTIISETTNEGVYSARSGAISHNQQTGMTLTIDTTGYSEIRFDYRVSSENSYDYLHFDIDGIEQDKWSGTIDWTTVTYPVTDGEHTFEWRYSKDGSASDGEDCGWIDHIVITP